MCSWALMWFHLPWPVPVNHRCGIDLEPMCAVVSSVQIIHFSICLEYMSISCIVVRLRESIQRLWVTWWWRNPSRWGRLESSPHSTERMLVRHLFCNLHSVKLAHYEKMHIRIHLLSLQYKKKQSHFYLTFRPLMSHILEGISSLELVPSQLCWPGRCQQWPVL